MVQYFQFPRTKFYCCTNAPYRMSIKHKTSKAVCNDHLRWCLKVISDTNKDCQDTCAHSKKRTQLSTSLYQYLYRWKSRKGQSIYYWSHCQIKSVSKQKPFFVYVFVLVLVFLFVRSKKTLLCFFFYLVTLENGN